MEWDLSTGAPRTTLSGHTDAKYQMRTVTSLAFAADGSLISGSWDKTVRLWKGPEAAVTFKGHEAAVWAVCGLANGNIVSGSADKTIKIWSPDGTCLKTVAAHGDAVRDLKVLPGVGFVSVGNDGMLKIWSDDGSELHVVHAHDAYIYSVALSPDGKEIYTCGEDMTVKVWRDLECRQAIPCPAVTWAVTALPSGDIVIGCADNIARVWTRDPSRAAGEALMTLYQGRMDSAQVQQPTGASLKIKSKMKLRSMCQVPLRTSKSSCDRAVEPLPRTSGPLITASGRSSVTWLHPLLARGKETSARAVPCRTWGRMASIMIMSSRSSSTG